MRGAADTPGRSRIRGLALEIGGVCAAATGPGITAQRQALFVLPGRVFAGDLPRLEIGRFRAPPEPPSEPPSGSPSPPLAMALSGRPDFAKEILMQAAQMAATAESIDDSGFRRTG